MDPFHERLARTRLAAADRYGFALAGGYAVQAAGLVERPSEDVDLFTAWDRREEFTVAVAAVVNAYRNDGLSVETERQYDTFARLADARAFRDGHDGGAGDPLPASGPSTVSITAARVRPTRGSVGKVIRPSSAGVSLPSTARGRGGRCLRAAVVRAAAG